MRRVTPQGTVTAVATTVGFARGVAVDGDGTVYTADGCSHTITKHVPGGGATVIAGTGVKGSTGDGGLATAAAIVMPDGIDVDAAGNVYFTESGVLGVLCGGPNIGSERVRMIDTNEGPGGSAGLGDGVPATLERINTPEDVAVAPDGTIYVSDLGNGTIRILRREPF